METLPDATRPRRGSPWEVVRVFLKLGSTSFGGPIAHLGFFRTEFVERRRWLDDREYADLVALCQFLPGPASSQVGFAVGMLRAGVGGAFAAFAAFTLPSAVLMIAFAYGTSLFAGPIGEGVLSGMKIVAVAIIAQAVWGMARTLTPDATRAGIAVIALLSATLVAGSAGQVAAILVGAIMGLVLCRTTPEAGETFLRFSVRKTVGIACLVVFGVLLVAAPIVASRTEGGAVALFDAFYRAGALVFGGGHVVLPLLQAGVVDPGWIANSHFLAGYGAAQAVPGPMFAFAGYLGALGGVGPGGIGGAAIALIAVFLPGMLLLVGVLPFWDAFRRRPWAQALMRGVNAAVVGILAAALYSPVFTTAITGPGPFCLAVTCFVLLVAWKFPPAAIVLFAAGGGILLALI